MIMFTFLLEKKARSSILYNMPYVCSYVWAMLMREGKWDAAFILSILAFRACQKPTFRFCNFRRSEELKQYRGILEFCSTHIIIYE